MNKMIQILNILNKYFTENQKLYPFWAKHDVVGFHVDYEKISVEDFKILQELGVFFDEDYNSLIMFT